MNRFFKKILSILIASSFSLVVINYLVWESYSPKEKFSEFESSFLVEKHAKILQHFTISSDDRLFFGTSKIFRHFDPKMFDGIVGDGQDSFNFGHAGLFPFRLLDYIELVIKQAPKKFRGEIFIELTVLQDINNHNYNTTEIQSSLSVARIFDIIEDEKYFGANHMPSAIYLNRFSLFSLIKKYTSSGVLGASKNNFEVPLDIDFIHQHRGYYPLELDKSQGALQQRISFIHGDSTIHRDTFLEPYENFDSAYENYLLAWLNEINCKVQNVYFIITPRHSKRNLKYILSLAEALKNKGYNVINLADKTKYPELYTYENSFDRGHLNLRGNQFFNQYLAELYNRITQEK